MKTPPATTKLKNLLRQAYNDIVTIDILQTVYHVVAVAAVAFLLVYILTQIISRLRRPASLKLAPDSVVVVVGACMGIGKIMALELADKYKSQIVVVDRRKDLFEDLVKEIQATNASCQCLNYNLADLGEVQKLATYLKKSYPKIDLLLYNAGIFFPNEAWDVSDFELHSLMNVNFFSPVKLIKELLPNIEKSQGKHIAVVASVASFFAGANLSSYCASKHALYGFLNSFRLDLKRAGRPVTLSIACPYAINTTMFTGYSTRVQTILPTLDEEYVGKRLAKEFMGRKQVCNVGRKHTLILRILMLFPTFLLDIACRVIDQSNFEDRKVKGRESSDDRKSKKED